MIHHHLQRLRAHLWEREGVDAAQRRLLTAGRYLYVLARDLLEGQLNMRAMSLVYTTLLSIVPMLALAFSVLKALGVHNSLEPLLLEFLRPLGAQGIEITANVIGFVEKIQVGVLGSLGVALLFYAAVSMIQKVESSFNTIWRIEAGRPLSQRLGEYLAVLTVGPVLVFSALGLTATLMSSSLVTHLTAIEPLGFVLHSAIRLVPYALIIGAFTFVYSFVPNTRVAPRAAFIGGITAGVLWQTASLAFASFVASSTNYNAIYSGFAIFLFLLIWIYLGWLILLVGCQLAFYVQHSQHLRPQRVMPQLSGREAEYLTLMVMALVGRRFMGGQPPLSSDDLAVALNAAPEHVQRVVKQLHDAGVLVETLSAQDRQTRLTLGLDPGSLSLARLWRLARAGNSPLPHSSQPDAARVRSLLDEAEAQLEAGEGAQSLRDWLSTSKKP